MGSMEKKIIELEDGWKILSTGISKLKRLLDDKLDGKFTGDEWMRLYTYVTPTHVHTHTYICMYMEGEGVG